MRDQAHENGYAKALGSLGIDWVKTRPIPKTNASSFPEVTKHLDLGPQGKQHSFCPDSLSQAGRVFPGLDKDLLALVQQTTEMEMAEVTGRWGTMTDKQVAARARGVVARRNGGPAQPT